MPRRRVASLRRSGVPSCISARGPLGLVELFPVPSWRYPARHSDEFRTSGWTPRAVSRFVFRVSWRRGRSPECSAHSPSPKAAFRPWSSGAGRDVHRLASAGWPPDQNRLIPRSRYIGTNPSSRCPSVSVRPSVSRRGLSSPESGSDGNLAKPIFFIESRRIAIWVGKNYATSSIQGHSACNFDGVGGHLPSYSLPFVPLVRGQACNYKGRQIPVRVDAQICLPLFDRMAERQHHVPEDLPVADGPVHLPHPLLLIVCRVDIQVFGKLWLSAPKVGRDFPQASLYHIKSATDHAKPRPRPSFLPVPPP